MEYPIQHPREIEAKFHVASRQIFSDLLAVRQCGTFTLSATPEPEQQTNVYFDTQARDLRLARHGFRVRMVAGNAKATLKGPAITVGSAQSRTEWEVALPDPDPNMLPDGELREHLLELTKGAPLLPMLTIRTTRQIINAFQQSRHALEIALDDLVIEAGSRTQASLELEIELLSAGTSADLEAMVTLLAPRYHLTPEPRSKLARGLELLEGS
jgi:triphosphatase